MDKQPLIKYGGKWITVQEYERILGFTSDENILKMVETALDYFNSQGVKPTLRTIFYYLRY